MNQEATDPALALGFPGQGSQSVGMLAALAAAYDVVGQTFEQASEALGYDLWDLCQNGPEQELNRTYRTQPALLAAGVAVWRVWRSSGGVLPARMVGHSLGEYSALVCADSLDFDTALRLVEARGHYMQEAVPTDTGAMAAILGLKDEQIKALCQEAAGDQVVAPANFNSPGQVVVAGHRQAVERAASLAKQQGAKRAVMLAVSVPSHCALMQPAAERLARDLAAIEIKQPTVPVLHNVDAAPRSAPAEIREALAQQLYMPVQWVRCVRSLVAGGAERMVEAGPGKVLTGLNRRIDKTMTTLPVFDPESLEKALQAVGTAD